MTRRAVIGLVVLVLTGLAFASVAGHTSWDGAVLITATEEPGLNEGDLPVLAGWLLGVAACTWLWRDSS